MANLNYRGMQPFTPVRTTKGFSEQLRKGIVYKLMSCGDKPRGGLDYVITMSRCIHTLHYLTSIRVYRTSYK